MANNNGTISAAKSPGEILYNFGTVSSLEGATVQENCKDATITQALNGTVKVNKGIIGKVSGTAKVNLNANRNGLKVEKAGSDENTALKNMMAFVTSTEDLTKGRFIWMSLFPTLCFGFLPYVLFIFNSEWTFLGYLGAFSISMGAGDFCNIFFALTQMPKESVTFLSGIHSYWYIPEK